MGKRYKLVVFDWEGTIAEDGLGHMIQVLASEANDMHLGTFDKSLARRCIGLGVSGAVKQLFPALYLYQQEQLTAGVQSKLGFSAAEVVLVDGAKETIQSLHAAGFLLAIATNKGHVSLQRVMQMTGLESYFAMTRSASQVPPKPCPQMLEEIMQTLQIAPEETLMIGDSQSDMQMAVAAQADGVGVDFYQTQRDELLMAGAFQVFSDYQQINAFLHVSGD